MRAEIEILQVEKRIRSRVKKQMEKTQKEYYLNEQMQAIQKELGEKDEFKNEIQELEEKIKTQEDDRGGAGEGREGAQEAQDDVADVRRGDRRPQLHRLDHLAALGREHRDKLDIGEAEKILEEDHYGLEKVKQRILEYLAVQALVGELKGPILCLVGPPGVGKTSLGKSIARATGRKFVRLSLGGVRDEAEIRGHRRTYIGALPGKIIQSMKKAGSNNPVFLLDEVDKMSTDFRGDPSSALLEVLDPEQNTTFNDHYLDLDYDLSKVMFITTANTLERHPAAAPGPHGDHPLAGYTEFEKLNIAKKYLVPKQREANGLKDEQHRVHRQRDARHRSATTRRRPASGTSSARSPRSAARSRVEVVKGDRERAHPRQRRRACRSTSASPKFRYGQAEEEAEDRPRRPASRGPSSAASCSRTEVAVVPGKGKLIITGRLGEVMQESAQAAMSYVRSRADDLGLERDFYQKIDIHIHVPEGAIPKDGPSAGITHGDGARLGADAHPGAPRPRDDRRDHAARPRAADRRAQGEDARGAPRRHQARPDPGREREGHPRDPGRRS